MDRPRRGKNWLFITKVAVDCNQGKKREGPSRDVDPGDSHSGEGLASVRPRLARTLADSALRSADRQLEASSRTPQEPAPEPEAKDAPQP